MKCSGCGKKLEPSEISVVGPDVMVWCANSVCRGQAKFMQEARRTREVAKLKKVMRTTESVEVKIVGRQLLRLLDFPLVFYIEKE